LARQHGHRMTYLEIDCYSDYRRDGRTWLYAGCILERRQGFQNFYVPSFADRFTYYLIKKILKQSFNLRHLERLAELFCNNPAECRRRIAKLWPAGSALALE